MRSNASSSDRWFASASVYAEFASAMRCTDRAERFSHRANERDVGARLDLQFDLAIAEIVRGASALHERVGARLNSDRDSRGDAIARSAEQFAQRNVRLSRRDIPHPHLDRGLGHVVAADVRRRAPRTRRADGRTAPDHATRQPVANGKPRRVDRLGAVVGLFAGHALGPPDVPSASTSSSRRCVDP